MCDARNRHCLFDADADECLMMTIIAAKKELDQLDDLVNGNSVYFKHKKWKVLYLNIVFFIVISICNIVCLIILFAELLSHQVLFSDDFRKSFGKLTFSRLKKVVLNVLLKLSGGWRPNNKSVDICCENSSQILKKFRVEGLYIICSVDIIKEVKYIQVLKVWDILPLEEIPKLTKRLESIFSAYTDDYINRCTSKSLEGYVHLLIKY